MKNLLQETLNDLKKASHWLLRSYEKCQFFDPTSALTEENLDDIEALTARFARMVDLLINKVFRAVDQAEYLEQGTMIDIINRMQKRGIIEHPQQIRMLKDLRNQIAHDYISDDLVRFLDAIRENTPLAIKLSEKTIAYCQQHILDKT